MKIQNAPLKGTSSVDAFHVFVVCFGRDLEHFAVSLWFYRWILMVLPKAEFQNYLNNKVNIPRLLSIFFPKDFLIF